MLATWSNVPGKTAKAQLLQACCSLGIGAKIARIFRCIVNSASSKVIVICPFTGYMYVWNSYFIVHNDNLRHPIEMERFIL